MASLLPDTPIGRDAELAAIERIYLDAVERAQPRVVSLVGGAGVGTTTLVDELVRRLGASEHRPVVLRSECPPDGSGRPLAAVRDLVAQRFAINDDDSPAMVAARLDDGFTSLSPAEADIVGQWLGFDLGERPGVRDLAGTAAFGAIALGHLTTHFRSLLDDAPLVLIMEDLQWSDPESLDLFGRVVDIFADAPVLAVGVTRPELFATRPDWSAGPVQATTTIELAPLTDDDLTSVVGRVVDDVEIVRLVVDLAGGVPRLADELVGLSTDDDQGARHLTAPVTTTEVVRRRLEALPTDDRATLRRAALVGSTFWDDAVVAAAGGHDAMTHAEVSRSLHRLAARGLIASHPRSTYRGCREYAFRHQEVRAIASDGRDGPAIHARIADWIEHRAAERAGEHVVTLASHLAAAGELERAADLFHEAGARETGSGCQQSAVDHLGRTLELRGRLGAAHGIAATSARVELAHLLAQLGRNDEAAATAATAIDDALRAGSLRLAASAIAIALRTAAARGDWENATELLERGRPLVGRFGGEVRARFLSGEALLLIDGPEQDLASARDLIEESLAIWRSLDDPAAELRSLNELGLVAMKSGRPEVADRWFVAGLELARRIGDTSGEFMLVQNRAVLAHLQARVGLADYERGIELYRESLDRRRRLGLPHVLGLANLAQAEVEAGRFDEGRRDATEALRLGWARHDPLDWTIAVLAFAQLAFADGDDGAGVGILAALLDERRSPSLEREIAAVLAFHGVDHDVLTTTPATADLPTLVEHLLATS